MSIHVTIHSKDTKMENIQSIGTSAKDNPICQKRRKVCGGICAKCYAERMLNVRTNLEEHLENNMKELTDHLLTEEEAKAVIISSVIARIESFGDVCKVIQARNYLRIIKAHPEIQFGIWSKNDGIWYVAFKAEGKPKNCTYVHSSMNINEIDVIAPFMKQYVDHVFTTWDAKHYAQFVGGPTDCAGIRCFTCRKCYKTGTSYYINEKVR